MAPRNILTVYHMMDARGVFDSNPANAQARDPVEGTSLYAGPQPYPKMFYHPKGEYKITQPGEEIETPSGKVMVINEKRELIYELAENSRQEKELRAQGWHDHPADAIEAGLTKEQRARGMKAPVKGAASLLNDKDRQLGEANSEIEELRARLAALEGKSRVSGPPA